MSKKWFLIYGIALVLLPILLIIVMKFKSPVEIMSPPSLYGQNAKIQKAFESSVDYKQGVSLKYPSQGKYRTAFVLYDLDYDNVEEAIVFYTLGSNETTVRVNILDYIDDEWESIYDEPGYGSEIISIQFDDLNNDKNLEIICCWSLYDTNTSKIMTVHTVEKNGKKPVTLKTLVNQSYNFTDLVDIDGDGCKEIFTIWSETNDKTPKAYAGLLKMTDSNTISSIGKNVTVDATVSSYLDMKIQKVEDKNVLLIDAYKGENSMITEVLYWNSEEMSLISPLLDPQTLTNISTQRVPAIPSTDIDNDGILEIPTNTATAQTDTSNLGLPVELTKWMSFNGETLVCKKYSYVNYNYNYAFILPDQLVDSTIAYMTDSGVLTVYATDKSTPFFSVVVKEKSKVTSSDTCTFKKVYGDNIVFGTLTSAGEKSGFTNSFIEKNIIFFKGEQ